MDTTARTESPFRQDDEAARLVQLCEKRDALRAELDRVRAEIARYRPWSWARFALGFVLTFAAATVYVIERL